MADCPAWREGAIVLAAADTNRMKSPQEKSPFDAMFERAFYLAEWTGLEPATPGVTGRYSNRLNYHSSFLASWPASVGASREPQRFLDRKAPPMFWRPLGDSNPCTHRERVMS